MIQLKQGVSLADLSPQIAIGVVIAHSHWRWSHPFVITSANDGRHRRHSDHFRGNAVDIRIRDPSETWSIMEPRNELVRYCEDVQRALGPEYVFLLEDDHIHMGWRGRRT